MRKLFDRLFGHKPPSAPESRASTLVPGPAPAPPPPPFEPENELEHMFVSACRETEVLLGAPAKRPQALINELQTALNADPRIKEAWFALAHWPKSGQSSWYLGVRADIPLGEVDRLLAHVFASAALLEGRPLDLVVNPPDERRGFGLRLVPAVTH